MNKEQLILEEYGNILAPWFYESFINHTTGKMDYTYFANANGQDYSLVKLRDAIKEQNNGSDVWAKQDNKSDISKEEFMDKFYECAKFLVAKDWIRYLWLEHKILLTRSDLFDWLYHDHPAKLENYVNFTGYGNDDKFQSDKTSSRDE